MSGAFGLCKVALSHEGFVHVDLYNFLFCKGVVASNYNGASCFVTLSKGTERRRACSIMIAALGIFTPSFFMDAEIACLFRTCRFWRPMKMMASFACSSACTVVSVSMVAHCKLIGFY